MISDYTVTGMSCEHCVHSVTQELTQLDGVTHVDIDLASGRVSVSSTYPLDDAAVAAAIDEAGYALASTSL